MYARDKILAMLNSDPHEQEALFAKAQSVRNSVVGDGVYLRGLIEYSNVCRKNCLYCGIRQGNESVERYTLTREQVLEASQFAYENRYGSVVLQGGELTSHQHIATIESLVAEIKSMSNNELGITLSFGEQTLDTYQRWFAAGAHRYLLRVESSNKALFRSIHPNDKLHSYDDRLEALHNLRRAGFQLGTGVMIGLPGQTVENLADDLLFLRELDIDMCGMGPYVECANTPLANVKQSHDLRWRLEMSLKMIATLRIIMPDINIAATTALQAIDPQGRLRAIGAGANIVMPNVSPSEFRGSYALYNNKPLSIDSTINECSVRYAEWGDSPHFRKDSK